MAAEEQGEVTGGPREDAEDRPLCSAGAEEETKRRVQGGNPEAGGEDSQDADGGACVQQERDPRRQLTCLEIPHFLQSDAVQGSTGNSLKKHNSAAQSCFARITKCTRPCVCVWEAARVTEGGKGKRKKKNKQMKRRQVPAEMAAEPELAKYWAQRYRLFSRFDEGIKLDRGQCSADSPPS